MNKETITKKLNEIETTLDIIMDVETDYDHVAYGVRIVKDKINEIKLELEQIIRTLHKITTLGVCHNDPRIMNLSTDIINKIKGDDNNE